MYQLTIDHGVQPSRVSDHTDFGDARQALLTYVVRSDYYLRPIENDAEHTSYELLQLADLDDPAPSRQPVVAAVATIERIETLAATAYSVSCPALRWIAEHAVTWTAGAHAESDRAHPIAILAAARGEAHFHLPAGTLFRQAAAFAGIEDGEKPDQIIVEALRHAAVHTGTAERCPTGLATAVTQLLPAHTSRHHLAAHIWYYALLQWGVDAP